MISLFFAMEINLAMFTIYKWQSINFYYEANANFEILKRHIINCNCRGNKEEILIDTRQIVY